MNKQRNVLKVASTPNEPFYIYDEQTHKVSGIVVDLLEKAYSSENVTMDYKVTTWEDAITMLKEGTIDIIPNIAKTEERLTYMDFSQSFRTSCTYVFYYVHHDIKSYKDLENKVIGVTEGYEYFLKFDRDHSLNKVETVNESILFKKLLKGQVDVVIMDESVGDYYIQKSYSGQNIRKSSYQQIESAANIANLAFSKRNNLSAYIETLNAHLEQIL